MYCKFTSPLSQFQILFKETADRADRDREADQGQCQATAGRPARPSPAAGPSAAAGQPAAAAEAAEHRLGHGGRAHREGPDEDDGADE